MNKDEIIKASLLFKFYLDESTMVGYPINSAVTGVPCSLYVGKFL